MMFYIHKVDQFLYPQTVKMIIHHFYQTGQKIWSKPRYSEILQDKSNVFLVLNWELTIQIY